MRINLSLIHIFPDAAALDEALNAEPAPEPAGNFHSTDDDLGVGGPKQKFARNIEAIRTPVSYTHLYTVYADRSNDFRHLRIVPYLKGVRTE